MAIQGSLLGNICAVLFFLSFQACGTVIAFSIFKKFSSLKKILFSSLFGTVLLMWTPVLFSFFIGFNLLSNLLALALCVAVSTLVFIKSKDNIKRLKSPQSKEIFYLYPIFLVFACFVLLIFNSVFITDGQLYSSQSTFGDMSMHLGFITSIANQGVFPPEYSILPGNLLSYPFLSDSISSSLYIFGASLRFSYILPMLFAGMQSMLGFYILFEKFLNSKFKSSITTCLFFLFGGFGIVYFLNGAWGSEGNFFDIFTNYYTTPTNYVGENIRWVTPIVDLLLPQRTTLFGFAVLFPTLYLLYKAVKENKIIYFAVSAVLTASLVMIHTHSFLVMVFFSVAWLFTRLVLILKKEALLARCIRISFIAIPVFMLILQGFTNNQTRGSELFLQIAVVFLLLFVFLGVFMLVKIIRDNNFYKIKPWLIFVSLAVVLSLGQLIFWTFSQAQGESFVRGYFNWANIVDNYLWFYIKNLGIVALLIIPAIFYLKDRLVIFLSPVILIWIVSELVVFQPNTYDNNKLLYPAFAFLCAVVVNFVVDMALRIRRRGAVVAVVSVFVFVGTISGILTIGREFVSEYVVFEKSQLDYVEFIENNTEADAVILTNTRHNNAVAAISGRNIVCGSDIYLFFHGLDYFEQQTDVEKIYSDPENSEDLLEEYQIDFIIISDYERNSYTVDEEAFDDLYETVYNNESIKIYEVEKG